MSFVANLIAPSLVLKLADALEITNAANRTLSLPQANDPVLMQRLNDVRRNLSNRWVRHLPAEADKSFINELFARADKEVAQRRILRSIRAKKRSAAIAALAERKQMSTEGAFA